MNKATLGLGRDPHYSSQRQLLPSHDGDVRVSIIFFNPACGGRQYLPQDSDGASEAQRSCTVRPRSLSTPRGKLGSGLPPCRLEAHLWAVIAPCYFSF